MQIADWPNGKWAAWMVLEVRAWRVPGCWPSISIYFPRFKMVMNHFLIIHPQDHPKVASWTHFSRVGFEDVQGQLYTKHRFVRFLLAGQIAKITQNRKAVMIQGALMDHRTRPRELPGASPTDWSDCGTWSWDHLRQQGFSSLILWQFPTGNIWYMYIYNIDNYWYIGIHIYIYIYMLIDQYWPQVWNIVFGDPGWNLPY